MKTVLLTAFIAVLLVASPASAYYRQTEDNPPEPECRKDGSACDVFCDNDDRAGTMYWNGSVWSDGVRWNEDIDVESEAIVAANGSACE